MPKIFRRLLALTTIFLPWPIKRRVLIAALRYDLAPSSYIGMSIILAKSLSMKAGARISHFTVISELDEVQLGAYSSIGNFNYIGGTPRSNTVHYKEQPERRTKFSLGEHSAVTSRHLFDCTDEISIGAFTTLAGYRTQLITHGINTGLSKQECAKIEIGSYCLIGTSSVILKGALVPDYCIIAAGAVVTHPLSSNWTLYGGVPAREISVIKETDQYFRRKVGFVQ